MSGRTSTPNFYLYRKTDKIKIDQPLLGKFFLTYIYGDNRFKKKIVQMLSDDFFTIHDIHQ